MTLLDDDTLTGVLVKGLQLSNRLRECSSAVEARAMIFGMSSAELRAVVSFDVFSYMQQRLGPDSYADWQR